MGVGMEGGAVKGEHVLNYGCSLGHFYLHRRWLGHGCGMHECSYF